MYLYSLEGNRIVDGAPTDGKCINLGGGVTILLNQEDMPVILFDRVVEASLRKGMLCSTRGADPHIKGIFLPKCDDIRTGIFSPGDKDLSFYGGTHQFHALTEKPRKYTIEHPGKVSVVYQKGELSVAA